MADGAAALPVRVERHLARSGLLRPAAGVTVALSGGLDSVVLLHLLRFPLRHVCADLRVAHLDHAMRAGSDADARWVRGLCRAWGLPLSSERARTAPVSEAEARGARYAFLERAAPAGHVIATAHHLDDQAETVLFRAIRGTGLRGLAGIRARRGRIIRPLLPYRRAELAGYARAAGLAWREDPTNVDPRFARNRLRHVVLPALERSRPGAARSLALLAGEAAAAEVVWKTLVERLERDVLVEADAGGAVLARDVLQSYHPLVRARVLRHVLRRYGCMPDRAGTHAALEFINTGRSGGGIDLRGGVRIEADFDRVRIRATERAAADDLPVTIPGPDQGAGRGIVGGRSVDVRWGHPAGAAGMPGAPEAHRAVLPDGTRFPLVVRGWAPGDRIRMAYGTKKLKKLFAERKLDREARRRTPLLVDAGGRVLWAVGVARAADVLERGGGFEIVVADAEQS